ncbi:hypothetical protein HU200_026138 [Digitaria exilis]|uniref:Uncharacterized protein n=1 Tax=Digitaria exilis TaxID=1010633 RepID=A0A835BZM7_9POAL|nr:hypothetical protein HU200_026138 [Digitaria exilis]
MLSRSPGPSWSMTNPMACFNSVSLGPSMLPLTSSTVTRSSGARSDSVRSAAVAVAGALMCTSTAKLSRAVSLATAGCSQWVFRARTPLLLAASWLVLSWPSSVRSTGSSSWNTGPAALSANGGCDPKNTDGGVEVFVAGQTLPEKQRRWNVWLHSDVTVAWPPPMAPWQTAHDGVAGGVECSQKGFGVVAGACCANRLLPVDSGGDACCAPKEGLVDGGDDCCAPKEDLVWQKELTVAAADCPNKPGVDDGCCPNMPVEDGGFDAKKEKGVDGAGAGPVAGAWLHRAAQTGHAAIPETQRRWNVWAHSDVNAACQSPMPPRQASHCLLSPPSLAMISGIVRDVSGVFDSIWRLPPSRP